MKNSVVLYNVSTMLNRLFSTITPIKYILTLVALLCVSSNAWSQRWYWTVNVGVASGKGTAKAEIIKHVVLEYWEAECSSSTLTLGSTSVTTNNLLATSNSNRSYKYTATPENGYSFSGWYNGTDVTGTPYSTSNPMTGGQTNKGFNYTFYAKFIPVTVNSIYSNPIPEANPLSLVEPGYKTKTVSFQVSNNADSKDDFYEPTIVGEGWSIDSWTLNGNIVNVTVRFTATQTTTQGMHTAQLTLTSKANSTASTTVAAVVDLTPALNANPEELDFGMFTVNVDAKRSQIVTLSFSVNAVHFEKTADMHIAPFSSVLSADNKTLTIYYEPTEVGTGVWEKIITITARNNQNPQLTVSKEIKLKGQAQGITNPEYTCNIADEYKVDDASLDLQSLWTSTSDGAITYSIESFSPAGTNNELAVKPTITDNRYLNLNQAGILKLKLTQEEASFYYAGADTKTIVISKYTPDFTWNAGNEKYYYLSSIANIFDTSNDDFGYSVVSDNENVAKVIDNTLHIYNVEETANITVTQAENYKWNGKTKTYTITPVKQNNHVEFTITNDNHTIFEESFTSEAEWNGSAYRFGDGGWTSRTDEVVISFTGIPDTLYFDKTLEKSLDQLPGTYLCRVYESVDGNEWKQVWEHDERVENKNGNKVPLSPTTKYIKFYYYGTVYANYKNIRVTERREFTAIPDAVDFGVKGLNHGEQDTLITFNHINAGRITKVELRGGDASYFSVTPTTIPNTGCDQYGTTYLNITFDNKKENRGQSPYNAELRIYDNNGHEEIVPLTGKRYGKSYPQFKWNPNGLPYYTNSSIVNIATSSNTDYTNCPLTYTTSDPTIAKVENGVLYIYDKEQEVTITVSQDGNNDFYAGSSKLTFTPRKRPDLVVPFHVTYDIYNKAVNPVYFCKWNESEAAIQVGENSGIFEAPAWDWNAKTALITFEGVPGKLSFKHRAINASSTNAIWLVEESADGIEWNEVYRETSSSTNYTNANDIELNENTRYLRFSFSGNFGGYIKDINVSELVGYKYLRAADGQYLSRGAKWGTQAVVDAFGVVSRISRYTQDNENIYTRFFFVDNEQYMFETETADAQRLHEVFTDNGTADNTNHLWQINNNGGILTIQSANDVGVSHRGNYITAINGVLAFTTNEAEATKWQMEDYTEHPQYITDMLNRQVEEAATKDFGRDINTLEKVRSRLKEEDFEILNINIPELELGEQKGESRTLEGMPQIYEQTITELDTGFYRLTVKALYRISNSEIAWKCNQEKGKESVLAYAYANNVQYPIQSVYASYHSSAIENTDEQHDGKYYSTTLASADKAFDDANRYLNDVYVYVAPDPGQKTGTLRYGIKCPSYVPGAWLAYENITLTHFKRKEYIYKDKEDSNTNDLTQWTEQYNWNRDTEPDKYHVAIIRADVIIDTEVAVYSMIIDTTFNPDVTVTIAPNGGLTVGAGGVKGATTDNFIIKASTEGATKGQTGYIRISPYTEQAMPYATMEMYSKAYFDMTADDRNNVGSWQYVGSPMAEAGTLARSIYKSSWIYNWNEKTAEWENNRKTLILKPFEGYCTSQYKYPEGMLITNTGQLASNGNVVLNLTYTGDADTLRCNVFANSYAAPIDITKFKASDFSEGVEATINLFNTGSKKNIADQIDTTDLDAPGQYIAIPVAIAADLVENHNYPAVIPAMQGFFVNTTKAGTLTLNYEQLVWDADYTKHANAPLRTKERSTTTGALCVSIEADGWRDNLYLLEAEKYDANYQNGYDARKMMNGELNIFAVEEENTYLAVDATHSLIDTRIGVRTGEETAYTFTFANLRTQEPIALMDNETEQIIPIAEGTTYTFFTTPNTMITDRFVIIANEDENAGVATNIQNTTIETKIHKFIKDNKLFILKDGILYNAQGQLVSK